MSIEEKYAVSKRKKPVGTFTAREIIQLLKIRELSTIHKVKVEDKEITVGEFTSAHDSGELPEQNIAEATPEETKPKETKPKKAEKVTPKAPSSPPPSKPKSAKPPSPLKPSPTAPTPTTGKDLPPPTKSADHKPLRSIKAKEDSRQTVSLAKRNENSGAKKDRSRSYSKKKSSNPILKGFGLGLSFIRKALLIGTFIIIAYFATSLLNHHRLKKELGAFLQQAWQLENIDMSGFTLEGYYLIDDPRKATVEILRNGERRSYEFKVTGNGITSEVKLEME